ncbi:hypothetical protein PHK61_21195 [Actinomycetospora lutea]|uniref:hypothetical protein n=1 Tax=Actinomycetospora lutea TaxID=663604 RepID=UPI0023670DCE|nr:hypothetical protein [Actinomycetospora lutea]MDD7940940.1 hypothetical protein [Actinomycetospora lutea]
MTTVEDERARGDRARPGGPGTRITPGPGGRAERPWSRVEPAVWGLGALSLVVALGFLLANAAYNQGRFSPPLDDVYIHLQYARQMGLGEFLRYQAGAPVTTGASSLLYVLVLGAAAALGATGGLLLYAALALAVVCTVATTVLTYHLGRAVASRTVGVVAGLLTALCGPLQWGALSGMEVGLVAALATGTVLAFVREQPTGRFRLTVLLGLLLTLTRPEGLVLTVAVLVGAAVTLVQRRRRGSGHARADVLTAALLTVPLIAALAQRLLYRALTGSAENNGVVAKSWLYQPLDSTVEVIDRVVTGAREAVATYGGLTGVPVVAPGTLLLAALGTVALVLDRPRHRTLAGVLVLGLGGIVLAVATLITTLWHNGRYVTPFLPLVLVLVVLGVRFLARAVPRHGRGVGAALLAVLVLVAVLTLPTWALRSAQQGAGIREASVSVAQWLRGNTPPGSVIAVNDVGATAYFGDRPVVDLVGLTTNGLAEAANEGTGALYEALSRLPADQRPSYFAVFPSFNGVSFGDMSEAGVLGEEPLTTFQTRSPARDVALGGVCQASGGCSETDVWAADWSVLGSGDAPDRPVPGRVVDHVDVGDPVDEEGHGYTVDRALVGLVPMTILRGEDRADGRRVVDSGREIVGGEHFTLRGLTPGVPVTLTARVEAREPLVDRNTQAGVVAVGIDGHPAGEWAFTTDDRAWTQDSFVIPGELITRPELTVSVGPRQPYLQPYPDYRSFSYWASQ